MDLILKEIENIKRSLSIIEKELKQIQNPEQEIKIEGIEQRGFRYMESSY